MLERQQNLKRLSITTALLRDSTFEIVERNCKKLEFLNICAAIIFDGWHRTTDVHIANEIILKNIVIKQLKAIRKIPTNYFPRTLIQACKELVSLNMEGKLFHFLIYNYICV